MRYHRKALIWATWIALAATGPAAAQSSMPGIFGVYNPSTGQFQPTPVQMAAPPKTTDAPFAVVSRSGTFVFRINITVESGSPSTTLPQCYVSIYHYPSGHSYSESSSVVGTRTGNQGQCIIKVPYLWTQADDTVTVQMSINAYVGNLSSGRGLTPIPLPANGANTLTVVPIVM